MLVYDCEIYKAIQGRKEERIEGIEYCAGWGDFKGMGISCICVYDYQERRVRIFCQDNLGEFQDLLFKRDILIGFNSINFDNKLISAAGIQIPTTMLQYDILQALWKAHGLGPVFNFRTHGGYGLDATCEVNFPDVRKTGHGALAPIDWQRGKIGSVIDYCINDVRMTVKLLERLRFGAELISPKTGQRVSLEVPHEILEYPSRTVSSSPREQTGGNLESED